jgi:hypothetical protein
MAVMAKLRGAQECKHSRDDNLQTQDFGAGERQEVRKMGEGSQYVQRVV